jgi:hypothetical protein
MVMRLRNTEFILHTKGVVEYILHTKGLVPTVKFRTSKIFSDCISQTFKSYSSSLSEQP